MSLTIETRDLRKRFGRGADSWALDGVDHAVEQGEIHGFLGPNGAGKSTTIRVLLGLIRATSGQARVFGLDSWRDQVEVHRRAASVPGDVSLWPQLTGGEAIDTLTRLRGARPDPAERERLVEAFDLDVRKRCRSYSKGNRQKVALVAALASAPDLLVLDEPTSGLDPLMEQVFRDEVRRAAERGATVLLSSHILSEVEQLCSRMSIIRAGAVVESGTLEQMRHVRRSEVHWEGGERSPESLRGLPLHDVGPDGAGMRAAVDSADLPAVLEWLGRTRAEGVTVQPVSLEQLFLSHYARGSRDTGDSPRQARRAR